ncbi:2-oxo-4-hydroxy-4-carboxy-5-ureidoimidazoline decarboxylase [Catenulispora sp. NL8]|uniref:2-oxo-4-hydroxy-4-carboxy-5-ureidoimidazoline decarboxylase n=1 Tax=Catenulispora pinistramenti TaxID=2705254 RepID=A0ABS5KMB6_9ACTN|nr:2-oxo-4-hydroxy-4-carboxy-5-ureidoimidazoline decarboxylase [Catenulispora pinistramenti]MBS2547161.1 2-oxo-4-hydroxy-4-carboxy-5-ureidoimidazoline decarboxylase [Catenulispora pinistramenti]
MRALAWFNTLTDPLARAELEHCCASPEWSAAVSAGRPYQDTAGLLRTAGAALARLDWSEVRRAADAHPRIGEPPAGRDRSARWSRAEQSRAAAGSEAELAVLRGRVSAYEDRFGHRFLIRASGLSPAQICAEVERRCAGLPADERASTRAHLTEIAVNRLKELVADG